jgi:hypothetical protein
MSTGIPDMGSKSFEERLEVVLGDRKIHPWGKSLGMTRGTIQRLKEGSFPDPEKLMPACRVENLSLSWLLFGLGTPYIVSMAVDGADAFELIDTWMAEEKWNLLIAQSDAGWLPVLYQPADLTLPDGSIIDYRAIQVISGNLKGCESFLRERIGTKSIPHWAQLSMQDADWRRLASGHMGSVELFRDERMVQHSFANDLELPWLSHRVEEAAGVYGGHTSAEREALSIVRVLDRPDQSAAIRMLRGLAIKHED